MKQVVNSVPTTYTQDLAAPLPVVLQAQTGTTATLYLFDAGTRPLAEYDSAWEYLLPDGLGSVRQLVDAGGNVKLAESYEPYGSVLSSQGSATSAFGFTGEQFDASTQLVFLRARYMQPGLGVFLSRDVWEGDDLHPCSMNGWNYVEGNPANWTDPTGRVPQPPFGPTTYEYSCNCGWIDYSHASPDVARSIIDKIKTVQQGGAAAPYWHGASMAVTDPIEISEGGGIGGVRGRIVVNNRLGYKSDYLYGVSLGVFKELNDLFENYQGGNAPGLVGPLRKAVQEFRQGPMGTDPFTESSFSQEDLMSDLIGFYMAVAADSNGSKGATIAKIKEACKIVGLDDKGNQRPDYQQKQQAAYEKSLIVIPSTASLGSLGIHYFRPVHTWFSPWLDCDLDDCKNEPQRLPDLFSQISPIPHSHDGLWYWHSASAYLHSPYLPEIPADYDVRELNR